MCFGNLHTKKVSKDIHKAHASAYSFLRRCVGIISNLFLSIHNFVCVVPFEASAPFLCTSRKGIVPRSINIPTNVLPSLFSKWSLQGIHGFCLYIRPFGTGKCLSDLTPRLLEDRIPCILGLGIALLYINSLLGVLLFLF